MIFTHFLLILKIKITAHKLLTSNMQQCKLKKMKKIICFFSILLLLISCNNDYISFKAEYNNEKLEQLLDTGRKSIPDEFKNRKYDHFVQLIYFFRIYSLK